MNKKDINLIVIADRNCTTSMFYLEYLHRYGYRPWKIYVCNFLYRPSLSSRKEKLVYLLSHKLYKKMTGKSPPSRNEFQFELYDELQSSFDFKANLDLAAVNYNLYSDSVETITAWNYKDPDFQKLLLKDTTTHYLYTNGGIIPQELFDQKIKILHVHPGIVPGVKGSDGLLWSLIERGKIGYSCFYMNAGIDTGDVIHQEEFKNNKFPNLRPLYNNYSQEVYAALLASYDPHFRARVLINVINKVSGNLSLLKAHKQEVGVGREFFSMHPLLVKKCLLNFF
jgi:hypothetical protein